MLNSIFIILGTTGIMLVGNSLISINLRNLLSHRLNLSHHRTANYSLISAFWSILFGFVSQTINIIIFILASLRINTQLNVEKTIWLLTTCAIGASLSVFNLAFSNAALAFVLLSIAGFGYIYKVEGKLLYFRDCILGFGLLYLGQNVMLPAIENLKESPYLYHLFTSPSTLTTYAGLWLLAVLLGITSVWAPLFLTLGFAAAGLLSFDKCLFLIYGLTVGRGIYTVMVTIAPGPLHSETKKLGMFTFFYTLVTTLLLIVLFFVENEWHIPLVQWLIQSVSGNVQTQIMLLYVFTVTVCSLLANIMAKPLYRLCEYLFPTEAQIEDFSKPKFLIKEALFDPKTAINQMEQEQKRSISLLEYYFSTCRQKEINHSATLNLQQLHEQFKKLSSIIEDYYAQIFSINKSDDLIKKHLNLIDQHQLTVSLEDTIYQFAQVVLSKIPPELEHLIASCIESQDLIYLTLMDILNKHEEIDFEFLTKLGLDKKKLLDELLNRYLNLSPPLDEATKSELFIIIHLIQRSFWLMQKLGKALTSRSKFS